MVLLTKLAFLFFGTVEGQNEVANLSKGRHQFLPLLPSKERYRHHADIIPLTVCRGTREGNRVRPIKNKRRLRFLINPADISNASMSLGGFLRVEVALRTQTGRFGCFQSPKRE